jgi:hypothetical protein
MGVQQKKRPAQALKFVAGTSYLQGNAPASLRHLENVFQQSGHNA